MSRVSWSEKGWLRRVLVTMTAALLFATCSFAYAQPSVLVFGDSLSAGYGLDRGEGWVALLRDRLEENDRDVEVVNASVSGETTAGGRGRLDAALKRHEPAVVILELGGNDGLRALPVETMKANLAAMIEASRDSGAKVLLLGMRIPSNYGKRYADQFHQAFVDLAEETEVAFVPFFLEDIATDRGNFQNDGVHPNAKAQPAMLDAVWPELAPLIDAKATAAAQP
ncbi:arylesterase [Salinisphaera sp.]|uniref:arylesterase n=1 Tax=Salinisphaera sp. TaxID=1914330 RepID=UPI0025DD601E|nr:arylesterase [Salinisphaera sp.]